MKLSLKKIKALEKKVLNEAKRAVKAIYKSHSKEMIKLIAEQIPKGQTMICGNGISRIGDVCGRAWGATFEEENDELVYISTLQYHVNIPTCFNIPRKIKSKKK